MFATSFGTIPVRPLFPSKDTTHNEDQEFCYEVIEASHLSMLNNMH